MRRYRDMPHRPPDFPDDPDLIEELIEEAFQRAAREGLIVDTGERVGARGEAAMRSSGKA